MPNFEFNYLFDKSKFSWKRFWKVNDYLTFQGITAPLPRLPSPSVGTAMYANLGYTLDLTPDLTYMLGINSNEVYLTDAIDKLGISRQEYASLVNTALQNEMLKKANLNIKAALLMTHLVKGWKTPKSSSVIKHLPRFRR